MSKITDTHRKLGVGEKVQWGDIYDAGLTGGACTEKTVGMIITEDTEISYYRPLNDERNAPELEVAYEYSNPGWPERPGSKVEVEPEKAEAPDGRAKTYDDGKPPLAQVPWAAVKEMASVQLYGQKKYGDFYNYRKGMEASRNPSCAILHIAAYMDGENLDPESQCSHLGHAMCRLAFVLQNMQDGTLIDDRYKGGAK